jgi:hypothetical protein
MGITIEEGSDCYLKQVERKSDEPMDAAGMGGNVQQFLDMVEGKVMPCSCGKKLECVRLKGYLHDGGLADGSGHNRRWWVYLHCVKCGYDWVFWKVLRRIEKAEMAMARSRIA